MPHCPATPPATPPGPARAPSEIGSEKAIEIPVDESHIMPVMLTNFHKMHVHHTQILAKLQVIEDVHRMSMQKNVLSSRTNDSFQQKQTDSFLRSSGENRVMSTCKEQEPMSPPRSTPPTPKMANGFGGSRGAYRNQMTVSYESFGPLSPTGTAPHHHTFSHASQQTSKESHLSQVSRSMKLHSSQETHTSGKSTLQDMERLAHIIRSHSNIYDRQFTVAHSVWLFLENRTSSKYAFFYGSYFAPCFLLVSVLISFFQTVEDLSMPPQIFSGIQSSFELWFASEICIRFVVCPDKVRFWSDMFNWIDLISVLPLFLRIYVLVADVEQGVITQVIALVPILRLMKIVRRFHKFQLLLSAFQIALEALPVLIFSMLLIAIMFSGLIFVLETEKLDSLPHASWFVFVTMTTVGYGDIYPDSAAGKFCSVILMVVSAMYMALPIGIVGNAFSEVWKDRDRLLLLAVLRENFAISGVSKLLIRDIFHHFSDKGATNNNSDDLASQPPEPEMSLVEFQKMIRALQIDVSDERTVFLFEALDTDSGGTISCDEFIASLFPSHFLKQKARPSMSACSFESQ